MTLVEPVSAKRSLPFGDIEASSQLGKFTGEEYDGTGFSKPALEDEKDGVPKMEYESDGVPQIAGSNCDGEVQRKDGKYDVEFHCKVEKYDIGDCTTYEKSTGDEKVQNIVQGTPIITVEDDGKSKQELLISNEMFDGEDRSSENKCDEEAHGKEDKNDGVDCNLFEKITGDKNVQNVIQGIIITGEDEDKPKQEVPSSSEKSDGEDPSEDDKNDGEDPSEGDKNDGGNCGMCDSTGDKKVLKVDQGAPIITEIIPVESEEKPEGEALQCSAENSDGEIQMIEKKHDGGDCVPHEKMHEIGEGTPVITVEGEEKLKGRKLEGHPKAIMDSIPTGKKRAADRSLLFTADSIASRLRKRACRC